VAVATALSGGVEARGVEIGNLGAAPLERQGMSESASVLVWLPQLKGAGGEVAARKRWGNQRT